MKRKMPFVVLVVLVVVSLAAGCATRPVAIPTISDPGVATGAARVNPPTGYELLP